MKIEKPTDDELRKQIIGSMQRSSGCTFAGLFLLIIGIISNTYWIGGIALFLVLMAGIYGILQLQDKTRLEIREIKRGVKNGR